LIAVVIVFFVGCGFLGDEDGDDPYATLEDCYLYKTFRCDSIEEVTLENGMKSLVAGTISYEKSYYGKFLEGNLKVDENDKISCGTESLSAIFDIKDRSMYFVQDGKQFETKCTEGISSSTSAD
jgi:hypothetical protein